MASLIFKKIFTIIHKPLNNKRKVYLIQELIKQLLSCHVTHHTHGQCYKIKFNLIRAGVRGYLILIAHLFIVIFTKWTKFQSFQRILTIPYNIVIKLAQYCDIGTNSL